MPEILRLPVTVSAQRTPRPGYADQLRARAEALRDAAALSPGHLASRCESHDDGAVTVTLTFESGVALAGWETSARRAHCVTAADEVTDRIAVPEPARPAPPPGAPPRWRTAVVVWAGLFPFSVLFTALAGQVVATMPVVLQSLVTSVVLVPLAVYVGIPAVNAAIRRCSR